MTYWNLYPWHNKIKIEIWFRTNSSGSSRMRWLIFQDKYNAVIYVLSFASCKPLYTSIIRLPNLAGHRCLSHFRSYMGTYLRVGFISSYLCGSLENNRWKSTLYKYQMLLETHFAQNFFKCYKQFGTKPNLLAKISATNFGNPWA